MFKLRTCQDSIRKVRKLACMIKSVYPPASDKSPAKRTSLLSCTVAMSGLMDSKPVLIQRLQAIGVSDAHIQLLVDDGVISLNRLAFCANYSPSMNDDTNLVDYFNGVLAPGGAALPTKTLTPLRQASFEAHTLMLSSLRDKVERKDDDLPRRVPQPERNDRLTAQKLRLAGVPVSGPLEPAYCLIDLVSQQK